MHLTVFSANKMLDFTWATATQNTSAKIHRYIAESSLRNILQAYADNANNGVT